MALGLRQTSHGSGAALPPPFLLFVAVGANFFQRPLPTVKSYVYAEEHQIG